MSATTPFPRAPADRAAVPAAAATTPTIDDRRVAAAALASLDRMYPQHLRALWIEWNDPRAIVDAIRSGRCAPVLAGGRRDTETLLRTWRKGLDLETAEERLRSRNTHVYVAGEQDFPFEVEFEDGPVVLFGEGDRPDAMRRPRVGVVGTRAATPHGLADAHELGRVLAHAGVTVVSGLAIGIDGAAHEGALAASGTVIGVLGTGLDVVYPRRHGALHRRVRERGMLVSEYRLGTGPHPARFPLRNRVIAALSDVVVVVEATATGGARITATDAERYGRSVCAYPGSRRNPSARGSNELIREGAHPIVDPDDVLIVLGLSDGNRRTPSGPTEEPATPEERATLRALGGDAATVDELTARTGLAPGPTAVAIAGLVRSGRIHRAHGLLWPR